MPKQLNLTQQAQREGLEARKVLREMGLDHEDRLGLFSLIASGSKGAWTIWNEALTEAKKRLSSPSSPER
jgi:hypothetical protein